MTVQTFLFDEIDAFKRGLQGSKSPVSEDERPKSINYIDEVEDLLIMAYIYGTQDANESLGGNESPDFNQMRETIEAKVEGKDFKVEGKDFKERIKEHLSKGDLGMIGNVADTDAIRVYNSAVLNTGIKLGATKKTWHTMEDERVRDTHAPLDGMTIPIDAYFYTVGDKALQPCGFSTAEENCNCRCVLSVS